MALDIAKIRNIGFVGHGGVGKTSLVEGMLHAAGAVSRLGRVDDGTTTTDFDPDEIKRKISLSTAVAFCDYKGHRLNLVDTPGYGDFVSDARAGLRAVGAAVVVVDAVAGVQVQTEKVWKMANDYGLPRIIVINRWTASGRTSTARWSHCSAGSRGGCARSRCRSAARRASRVWWIS